jgi:hypothetical protein
MPDNRLYLVIHIALISMAIFCSCTDGETAPFEPALLTVETGTFLIRQPREPGAVMEALFHGQVSKDKRGCLRLQPPTDATVVWPFGSALEARDDGEWVVDLDGEEIGKIGGPFRFGGGVVPFLTEGMGFRAPDITEIQTRCPGRYWIVGEVLKP